MNKKEKIIEYLKNKYDPIGIIIIGSRVTNEHTKLSDWDLFVFTDKKENGIEDFGELKEFEGEALEISPYPTSVAHDKNFILDTATHPAREAEILYDNSDGLMEKIIINTEKAYRKKPKKLDERTKNLYKKILNKFLRKAESRPENEIYVYFGISQFVVYAIRYWFEVHQEWPLPIYKALDFIKKKDKPFYDKVNSLISDRVTYKQKIKNMKDIRDTLFS